MVAHTCNFSSEQAIQEVLGPYGPKSLANFVSSLQVRDPISNKRDQPLRNNTQECPLTSTYNTHMGMCTPVHVHIQTPIYMERRRDRDRNRQTGIKKAGRQRQNEREKGGSV